MKWNKNLIEVNNLPLLKMQFEAKIKLADPSIENIRCVFGYKDIKDIFLYTAFDFIDNYEKIITQGQLERFYLYQPFA